MSAFTLHSDEVESSFQSRHEFNGFGGRGENRFPGLRWTGAPEGAKSYAVTLYDSSAPTGSGFWHFIMYDIPSATSALPPGLEVSSSRPDVTLGKTAANDFGWAGYCGPCPPPGREHQYIFTVHALSVDHIGALPEMTNALVRFRIQTQSLGTATLAARYRR